MKETVLITGAAGFIGSNIADYLRKSGEYRLILLDDLSNGRMENIAHLLSSGASSEDVLFVKGSINDYELLKAVLVDEGVDYVLHHAAVASVPASIADPKHSLEVNIDGTLTLFMAARDSGVKKVVYASSSAYYGEKNESPLVETMPPDPLSPYASSKVMNEFLGRHFNELYGMPTVGLRYFNVYGPRQDPNSQYAAVIPKFIDRCRKGLPPVIFGDGEQTRDFVYVKDVALANYRILKTAGADGRVINIGTGDGITVNRIAKIIIEMTGSALKPEYAPERPGDIRHSVASIDLARTLLGFSPRYDLRTGLKELIAPISDNP